MLFVASMCMYAIVAAFPLQGHLNLAQLAKMIATKLLYYMYIIIIIIMHVRATVSDVQSNWGMACHLSDYQQKVIVHTDILMVEY